MFVIKEPSKYHIDKVGIKGKIFPINNLISSVEYFLVETPIGHESSIIEHKCDFIYYILDGNGYFIINNIKEKCKQGDLVVIPAGNTFTYKGKLKMITTSTPPWLNNNRRPS